MYKKHTNSIHFIKINCSWRQLICTTLFLTVILSAFSHGTVTYPPSRVWNCFQEDPESPDSAACIAAVASHGTQPLYDWSEINQANANGNHQQYVKDGNLASGGRPNKYGGMDQVRSDWVSTKVSPGSFTVTWTNHAPHATAYYEVYITKASWTPDKPLTWDSLELLVRTPPSGAERVVNIPVTLPARTGKHVIYSIWQRSDSTEAFYSTSDIHFDGGDTDTEAPSVPNGLGASNATKTTIDLAWNAATDNVAVTGYDIYQGNTIVATATGTSYQVTGLTANTSYSFRIKAKDAANNQSGFSNTVNATTLPDTGGDNCAAYPTWSASDVYTGGKDVKYNNVHYQAKWWTQGQNPEANSGPDGVWKKIGSCDGSGGNNTAPTVSITSPANNASFVEGTSVSVTADASDADGTVTKVEFYNGTTLLGEDTTAPYQYSWANTAVGNYTITAKATDNKGAATTSTAISVSITKKDGGGGSGNCDGLPQYVAGTSYSKDQEVQNKGEKFKCNIPGWCSSAAAWAYAPGTGAHWQDAWSKTGDCGGGSGGTSPVVNITSPANGATYTEGSSIVINATATDDGTVTKVEFYNGSVKLGEDTTSPYSYTISNAQSASYSLTAVATDNDNNQTTSESVTVRKRVDGGNNNLPSKILVGYWHNFDNGSTTPRLSEVSRDWDVICVAFAEPKGGSTSDMQFSPYEIYGGNTQAFIDDVATVRSRGQKVLISIGGANAKVELTNESEKNEFVSSMTNIINTYGFDGLDIDLEGNSLALASGDTDFRNPTTPKIKNLIAATKTIRNNVGADRFILSMAPETAYVQGAYGNYSGIFGAYLPVVHALREEMNYIHVQHYNTGSMNGSDGKIYQPATADFHVAMAEMLITGFPVAQTGHTFPGLRADQVAIGLPASTKAAGSGYTSEAVVQQALDYLMKGISYPNRTYTTSATYPNFRGLMTWSINWDLDRNSGFSSSHRAYLDGVSSRSTLADDSSSVGKVFPNPLSGNLINIAFNNTNTTSKSASSDYFRFQIFNTSGVEVYSYNANSIPKGDNVQSFDIGDLQSGMYFYTISVSKDKTTGKFVKN